MLYQVIPAEPEAHIFHVVCTIPDPDPEGQRLSLPAWIPGSYMLREFARNIITIEATADGVPLRIDKLDKSSWRCAPCTATLEIRYTVYAWDISVRTAHFDQFHAYFNGTSLFLKVHGKEDLPVSVELCRPQGEYARQWRVATSLTCDTAQEWSFGRYKAENYDELIDHPVEMGCFDVLDFEAGGKPHHIVLCGQHRADTDRLVSDLQQICAWQVAMFGELPPLQKYVFLVWIVGDGYGGLEHRSSTSLLVSRNDLPVPGEEEVSDAYRSFLGLCSHEYFHTWNIKRIKPAAFVPYELATEAYTRQLWAFEGITSYYDDLCLLRSGVIDQTAYLTALAETMTRVIRGRGRFKQSVAESSFDAWTKFYRQDENAPNAIVSYYTKGSLIALSLDLRIRQGSAAKYSLDDLMRQLWQEYGKPGLGVPEGKIEEIASALAGEDLSDFFGRYLYACEDLPLAELLREQGFEYCRRPAESVDDKGGRPATRTPVSLRRRADLGLRTRNTEGTLEVANVFEGRAAMRAGIAAGDVLVALDSMRITPSSLSRILSLYRPGDEVSMQAFRGDILHTFDVQLDEPEDDTVEIRPADAKVTVGTTTWPAPLPG